MNHADVTNHLADYLEGDLGLEDRAQVDVHLAECEECAREVAAMEQTIRLLRGLPEPETPPMIAANVMRRIRAGESRPGFLSRVFSGITGIFEPSFVLPASAIAAAAAVVVVLQDPSGFSFNALEDAAAPGDAAAVLAAAPSSFAPLTLDSAKPTASVPRSPSQYLAEGRMDTSTAAAAPRTVARLAPEANSQPVAQPPSPSSRTVITITQQRRSLAATPRPSSPSTPLSLAAQQGSRPDPRTDQFVGSPLAAGAPPSFAVERRPENALAGPGSPLVNSLQAMQVAAPIGRERREVLRPMTAAPTVARDSASSGGEDPRDAWIQAGLENPADFARYLTKKTLAEQELWVARLARRAESRGLLGELVEALEATGDGRASALAQDFLAEAADR